MIRHLIVFNVNVDPDGVRAMAEEAKRELGAIPGVTDVRFGVATDPSARYRYVFDIGFSDESIIESYRTHPTHVRFAEERFRPMAVDRLTTDYRLE